MGGGGRLTGATLRRLLLLCRCPPTQGGAFAFLNTGPDGRALGGARPGDQQRQAATAAGRSSPCRPALRSSTWPRGSSGRPQRWRAHRGRSGGRDGPDSDTGVPRPGQALRHLARYGPDGGPLTNRASALRGGSSSACRRCHGQPPTTVMDGPMTSPASGCCHGKAPLCCWPAAARLPHPRQRRRSDDRATGQSARLRRWRTWHHARCPDGVLSISWLPLPEAPWPALALA